MCYHVVFSTWQSRFPLCKRHVFHVFILKVPKKTFNTKKWELLASAFMLVADVMT